MGSGKLGIFCEYIFVCLFWEYMRYVHFGSQDKLCSAYALVHRNRVPFVALLTDLLGTHEKKEVRNKDYRARTREKLPWTHFYFIFFSLILTDWCNLMLLWDLEQN